MNSLEELFIEELRDLYSAEIQLVEALANMSEAATSPDLKAVFVEHLDGTMDQLNRIEEIFKSRGRTPKGKHCAAVESLVQECRDLVDEGADAEVMDAALISIAQKAEHYEIAGYGAARAHASTLGDEKAEELLEATLQEEKEVDRKLSELAVKFINQGAREVTAAK